MSVAGRTVGFGLATSSSGRLETYGLVERDQSSQTIEWLHSARESWKSLLAKLPADVEQGIWRRVDFAVTVAGIAVDDAKRGVCCTTIAASSTDKLRGIINWSILNRPGKPTDGAIHLLVVDPENIAGTPYIPDRDKLRGVGVGLVAAVANRMLGGHGVHAIYLHPLDDAAYQFWTNRGFQVCGAGGLLCVRGDVAIRKLIDRCYVEAKCQSEIGCVMCGMREASQNLENLTQPRPYFLR